MKVETDASQYLMMIYMVLSPYRWVDESSLKLRNHISFFWTEFHSWLGQPNHSNICKSLSVASLFIVWIFFSLLVFTKLLHEFTKLFHINPSRPDPGWREKINLIFIFTLLWATSKCFMKSFKTFWGTTKKCENKNLS